MKIRIRRGIRIRRPFGQKTIKKNIKKYKESKNRTIKKLRKALKTKIRRGIRIRPPFSQKTLKNSKNKKAKKSKKHEN